MLKNKPFQRISALSVALCLASVAVLAQKEPPVLTDKAKNQIRELLQAKARQTLPQRKIGSDLVAAIKASRGQALTPSITKVDRVIQRVGASTPKGLVTVDMKAVVSPDLTAAVRQGGGIVLASSVAHRSLRARVPLGAVEVLAARTDVISIKMPGAHATSSTPAPRFSPDLWGQVELTGQTAGDRAARLKATQSFLLQAAKVRQTMFYTPEVASLNFFRLGASLFPAPSTGLVATQGIISHRARETHTTLGVTGTGLKVGVLSDSVDFIDQLKHSGDLPSNAQVLPGQDGDPGTSEGSAMMEIVYDMAPGAQPYFATAFISEESFADNIRALAAAGCKVIVDDVFYFLEGVFQDDTIARAVNDVNAEGVLYLSSAGNNGNIHFDNGGVFEGDAESLGDLFGDGVWEISHVNELLASGFAVTLQWSDALGASSNDYDLFIFDQAGNLIDFSTDTQDGTQDPKEIVGPQDPGSQVVAAKYSGVTRELAVSSVGGLLLKATTGATFGHGAAEKAAGVAAVAWNSAHKGTKPFTGGAANPVEVFSSDGPRRMYYDPTGHPFTPGNFLLATNGGKVLSKPDIAAADGVTTLTPGFAPFFGTSAAAPHAAAIAALVWSANPSLTNQQVLAIMKSTALDNMAPGVDINSGSGIVMALPAVQRSKAMLTSKTQ
jgi:subtilisin family serine protease